MIKVLIEGWLDLPHSYSIVNLYQIIGLSRYSNLDIYLKKEPKFKLEWESINLDLLLNPEEIDIIKNCKLYDSSLDLQKFDIIYRIVFPINISKSIETSNPIIVFYTSEFCTLPDTNFNNGKRSLKNVNVRDFVQDCKLEKLIAITPSKWSSLALKTFGYEPIVLAHGVDQSKYYPYLTNKLQFPKDSFIFLSVGACTGNKNIKGIIKSFYKISFIKKNIFLVLKGLETLYNSERLILSYIKELIKENVIDKEIWQEVKNKILYIPDTYTYTQMNELYNSCDCYISPYLAEGFNLPVLEAIACGKPVIIPKGGPTDDFTNDQVAKYIKTIVVKNDLNQHVLITDELSLQEEMINIINDDNFKNKVKIIGPELIKNKFSWKKITDQLYNLFEYITTKKKNDVYISNFI